MTTWRKISGEWNHYNQLAFRTESLEFWLDTSASEAGLHNSVCVCVCVCVFCSEIVLSNYLEALYSPIYPPACGRTLTLR